MSDHIFYVGATFTVEWYIADNGRMYAKEYYEDLPGEEKERLHQLVKYFADNPIGTRLPKTLYNLEDAENQVYAFKPKDYRFFNFVTAGRKIIIVHAYRKHSQRMTKKDLNLLKAVIEAKSRYFIRVKEGSYYEGHA